MAAFYNDKTNQIVVVFTNQSLAVLEEKTGKVLVRLPPIAPAWIWILFDPIKGNMLYWDLTNLVSLNLITSQTAWKTPLSLSADLFALHSLTTEDGMVLIIDYDHQKIYAVNCTSGSIQWTMTGGSSNMWFGATLTTKKGITVVIGAEYPNGPNGPPGYMIAIDPANGQILSKSPSFSGYLYVLTLRDNLILGVKGTTGYSAIYSVEYENMGDINSYLQIMNTTGDIEFEALVIRQDGTMYANINNLWIRPPPTVSHEVLSVFRPSVPTGQPCPFPTPPNKIFTD
jgi:outer membrane protein assembly factor BamB